MGNPTIGDLTKEALQAELTDRIASHITQGNIAELKKLLTANIASNTHIGKKEESILQFALSKNRPDMASWLYKQYPESAHTKNKNGETILHTLFKADIREAFYTVLADHPELAKEKDNNGDTVFHQAYRKKDIVMMKSILNKCPETSVILDKNGSNPLDNAVKNCVGGSGGVEIANYKRYIEIASIILDAYPEAVMVQSNERETQGSLPPDGSTPIHTGVKNVNTNIDMIYLLLDGPPGVESARNKAGETPLHIAVRNADILMMDLLMKKSLDLVNLPDFSGKTVLHTAIENNHNIAVWPLLRASPGLAATPDNHGNTPLHIAAEKNNLDITRLILSRYPEIVTIQNNLGHTALHIAARGNYRLVKFPRGSTISFQVNNNSYIVNNIISTSPTLAYIKDKEGNTALHIAAKYGNRNAAELLVSKYPELADVKNMSGLTPLQVAKLADNKELAELLENTAPQNTQPDPFQGSMNKTNPATDPFSLTPPPTPPVENGPNKTSPNFGLAP